MSDLKYELTDEIIEVDGRILHRIRALRDIGNFVKAGDLGGYVEKEFNLSHIDNSWIYGKAKVYGNALIYDNAKILGNAIISGNAKIHDDAIIYGRARIFDNAEIYNYALIYGDALISNDACICGEAKVFDNAVVSGSAFVYGNVKVTDNTILTGYAKVCNNYDYKTIKGFGTFFRCLDGLVRVNYGCFFGTIDEFREQFNKSKNNKVIEKCLKIVDMMEHFFQKNN